MKETAIYDYVFHLNIYTGEWTAIPREHYTDYWTDYSHPAVIRARTMDKLMDLVFDKDEPSKLRGLLSLIELRSK